MIRVSEPWITEADIASVTDALRQGFLAGGGDVVGAFERAWAGYCGRRHGVAVCNGTAALELAVQLLDLPKGSEVILPDFTIISCARAVVLNGLVPVFVDADPVTWTMDLDRAAAAVTPRTSAIMPVHMYGQPVDMEAVEALADHGGLQVIEDAAEAHGARCRGRRCGGFGRVSTFSFYANKLITTGEGGMVVFDDDELLTRCRRLRELGFSAERRFFSSDLSGNFRFTAMQAAVGLSQLERIGDVLERKIRMGRRYRERLAGVPGLQLPPVTDWADNVYWMFGVVLQDEISADASAVTARLAEEGIETRPFFLGMHEQPALSSFHGQGADLFPVSRRLARRGFYLPSGLTLTDDQIDHVASTLASVLHRLR